MTAHVVVRALDPRPATTSPAVIALLRETVGFDGVVLSDALDMRAVAGDRAGSVAADALAAGVDLLCLGNPAFPEPYDDESRVEQVLDEIVAAVEAGRLSVDRLTDAAGRVAGLRVPAPATGGPPAPVDGHEVAARALRVTGDVAVLRPAQVLVARPDVAMASGRRESEVARTLAARRPDWPVIEVDDATDVARALRHARHLGVVMLAEGRTDARTAAVVRAVLADRPDAVVVHGGAAGSPDLADRQIRTFGGGRAVAEAVVDRLLAGGDRRR